MPKGKCPHGEFDLADGCPKCIEEARILAAVEVNKAIDESTVEVLHDSQFHEVYAIKDIQIAPENDAAVLKLYEESQAMLVYAQDRVISDVKALGDATKDLALITTYRKTLEDKRKEYVTPIRAKLDEFNALFKKFMAPVTEAEELTRRKMLQFHAEQKRIFRAILTDQVPL